MNWKRWGTILDRLSSKAGLPVGISLGTLAGALLMLTPAVVWVPAFLVLFTAAGFLAWSGEPVEELPVRPVRTEPALSHQTEEPIAAPMPPAHTEPAPEVPTTTEPEASISEPPVLVEPDSPTTPEEDAVPLFVFNGIDGTTGEPLYPPMPFAELKVVPRKSNFL